MVHLLASHLRSEFLAVPELIRFDMAHGREGPEPTLLIKANSLSLKYLVRTRSLCFKLMSIGRKIACAIEIPDDPDRPGSAWSLMALPNEAAVLKALTTDPKCVLYLFNELAVSIAWTEVDIRVDPSFAEAIDSVEFQTLTNQNDAQLVGQRLDLIRMQPHLPGTQTLRFDAIDWHELHATYVTNQAGSSELSLFNKDEGGQQEEIAVWLTDSLGPKGCVKSPQVQEKVPRELSDILLTYEFGTFIIESKALNVLTRDNLPGRQKLTNDLSKHLTKAKKQLVGGIRNLKNDLIVKDTAGKVLNVERESPIQAIILVPDLSLLECATEFGSAFICEFMKDTGGWLHVLDPAELLRVVQAAEMIAKGSENLTKMMAFDWYLMERAKIAAEQATPYFAFLFRQSTSEKDELSLDS